MLSMFTSADRCTHKAARVETLRQIVQRRAIQQFLAAHVQGDVHAGRLDPIHVDYANEACCAA
jgi:hypothetical protein